MEYAKIHVSWQVQQTKRNMIWVRENVQDGLI